MRKPDGADPLALDYATPEPALLRPGMRRKSVLPKSHRNPSTSAQFIVSDDEDADEIEKSLFTANPSRDPSPLPPINDTSSILSEAPSLTADSRNPYTESTEIEIERVPTPIPSLEAVPTTTETQVSATAPESVVTASSSSNATIARTSPRKQPLSSQLGTRRPSTMAAKPRPSRIITPSAKVRSALSSVPEPNLPRKAAIPTSAGKRT